MICPLPIEYFNQIKMDASQTNFFNVNPQCFQTKHCLVNLTFKDGPLLTAENINNFPSEFLKSLVLLEDYKMKLFGNDESKNIEIIGHIKDKSLADLDNLPDPDIIASEIVENLEAGLESFREIMVKLNTK